MIVAGVPRARYRLISAIALGVDRSGVVVARELRQRVLSRRGLRTRLDLARGRSECVSDLGEVIWVVLERVLISARSIWVVSSGC